jgi:arylsulfatase A-like enzyme
MVVLQAWAMLEWLDGIYGRLFSYLESSPLGKNTYVMIMSDNGPQLLVGEKDNLHKMVRTVLLCQEATCEGCSARHAVRCAFVATVHLVLGACNVGINNSSFDCRPMSPSYWSDVW